MPAVNLTRAVAKSNLIARSAVATGQVFQKVIGRNDELGKVEYAAIGHNGKFLSVNLSNGELASTAKGDGRVAVIGKFNIAATYLPDADRKTVKRGAVKNGQLFRVKGKDTVYGALGTLGNRLASLNMDDPMNENYAVTSNPNSNVEIVGSFVINAQVAR